MKESEYSKIYDLASLRCAQNALGCITPCADSSMTIKDYRLINRIICRTIDQLERAVTKMDIVGDT